MFMKNYTPSLFFIVKKRLKGRSFLYEFYFKNKKTLDIGCGEGEFMKHDKELIYGLDPNKRVIDRLEKEGYKVVCSGAEKIPFADNEFETAHCHNVIEHLDVTTAYKMLMESARILRPGGILVLSSEIVTRKFWMTFGHVKPYPPEAVIKLLRPDSREEFDGLSNFEVVGLFYIGDYFKNKVIYLTTFCLGYFTPLFRREYFLVLRKNI